MRELVLLLKELIKIESISGNEAPLISYLSVWLKEHSPVRPTLRGRNIIIDIVGDRFDEQNSPSLLLCSHIDTVPPSDGWTKDPFGAEEINGSIFGLGSNDALASVVSMIFGTLDSLDKIHTGRVVLAIVCEEEKGNNGFVAIEPELPRYDYAIFGEPTSLRIGYCMRGSMKLKMLSKGKACHASRPHEGANAIFQLAKDLQTLEALPLKDSSPWGQATVQPTVVAGGKGENQIPDLVETILDVRTTPEKNNQFVLDLLHAKGIEIEVLRNLRHPMFCDENSTLVRSAKAAVAQTVLYPFGGSCDMAFSKSPSIVFGPGASERSHSADEFITISELTEARAAYKHIISDLCG